MSREEEIKVAQATLKKHGYCVEALWHIGDVKSKRPDITDEQAMEILDSALGGDRIMNEIWEEIK